MILSSLFSAFRSGPRKASPASLSSSQSSSPSASPSASSPSLTLTPPLPSPASIPSPSEYPREKSASHVERELASAAAPDGAACVDIPPDGGYGWICVACTFVINANTWGLNSAYGVFLAYYLNNDLFFGATYLDYALIGGLSITQAYMMAPIATILTRTYGTRATLLTGVFLETLSLVGASFATQKWHLFLSQGICFGWGVGFLFTGSAGIVSQWFLKRRGMANGISTAGSGIGGLFYSLATNAIIQALGLAWAFRILAIVSFVTTMVAALLVRDRNHQIGTKNLAFDHRLLRKMEFWLVLGWGIFSNLGYVVLLFSLPDYAKSIGLSPQQGSVIGAMLNLGQGIGRPAVGYFSDAVGRINMAGFATLFCGLLCFGVWIVAKTYVVLIFFALVVGTVTGVFWTTVGPVITEVVGLQDLQSGISICLLVLIVPETFAEPFALEVRQLTGGGYIYVQIFTAAMYICAAACLWFLRAWKIGDLQEQEREQEQEAVRTRTVTPKLDTASDRSTSSTPTSSVLTTTERWSFSRRLIAAKRV